MESLYPKIGQTAVMLWHFVVSRAGLQIGLRMLLWSRDLKNCLEDISSMNDLWTDKLNERGTGYLIRL